MTPKVIFFVQFLHILLVEMQKIVFSYYYFFKNCLETVFRQTQQTQALSKLSKYRTRLRLLDLQEFYVFQSHRKEVAHRGFYSY